MTMRRGEKVGILLIVMVAFLSMTSIGEKGQEPASKLAVFKLGDCQISVIEVSFWRDWMPIVLHPGPDHGSPLRAVVKLRLSKASGPDTKLAWTAAVFGEDGVSNPIELRALPENGAIWNRTLKKGESRELLFSAQDGPYLPVGSLARIEMSWTDQNNKMVVVRTQKSLVARTD
jgi:hypothetical protein